MLVKQKLQNQLKDGIKDAFEQAFKSAMKDSILGDQNSNTNKVIDKMADNFAKSAASIAADKLSAPLADAIDNYIKSASITITAAPQVGLAGPDGPVTGVVNVQPNFVTIS